MGAGRKFLAVVLLLLFIAGPAHAADLKILSVSVEPVSVAAGGNANVVVVVRNSGEASTSGLVVFSEPGPASEALTNLPDTSGTGAVDAGAIAAVSFAAEVSLNAESKNYPIKIALSVGGIEVDSATAYLNVNPTGEGPAKIPEMPVVFALAISAAVLLIVLRRE